MTESATTQVKPGAWLTGRSTYKRPQEYAGVSSSDPRVARAIDLVTYEAELLDRKNYEAWQELFAEDGFYVIPIDPEVEDFANHLNMVFDDDTMRRARVVRLTEGYAISAVDAAVTTRTLGRFIAAEVTENEVLLRAAQIVVAYKRGSHQLWAGDVEYRVRFGHDHTEDRLVLKVIRLIDSQDAVPASGFLL
jgi:3-phenylpropionate/cinnamic acid dioxygenase small subunit